MFLGGSLRPGERERDTVGKNEEEGDELAQAVVNLLVCVSLKW